MSTNCTRCEGFGYLNTDQLSEGKQKELDETGPRDFWDNNEDFIESDDNDVQVCDCCGDGESWYGEPGEHYNRDDPRGQDGPYAYNGGLCECN